MNNVSKTLVGACVGIVLVALLNVEFNRGPATEIKAKVSAELYAAIQDIQTTKDVSLANIGGVKWDYICYAGYYAEGVERAKESLKIQGIDFSDFSASKATYLDAEQGLTFVSLSQKLLVAILIKPWGLNIETDRDAEYGGCLPAENAYLYSVTYNRKDYHLLFKEKKVR